MQPMMAKKAAVPAAEEIATEPEAEVLPEPEAEPKWKPYVIYGGIAAGVLTAAGIVAFVLRGRG
jgi:hypothetical protein